MYFKIKGPVGDARPDSSSGKGKHVPAEGRGPTRIQKSVPRATGKQATGHEDAVCGREAGEASGSGGVECPRCRPPEQGVQGGLAGPRACWPQFRKHASLDEAAHPALNSFSRTDSRVNGGRGEALGAPTMRCLGSEGVCLGLVLPTWPRSRGDT